MSLHDITFIKGQNGLGRPLPGSDYISALNFYTANANLPSGWTTSARVKALFSPSDANSAGILPNYNKNNIYAGTNFADATAATYTSVITRGATGDTINIKCNTLTLGGVVAVNLGTYTQLSGDSTLALLGASIAAFINSGTVTHGYSASFATATLTIIFPKSQGTYPNTGTPVVITVTGTIVGATPALGVTGVQSLQAIWFYHISEYFRIQPKGQLFTAFNPIAYTFTDITTTQNFAQGKVRQIGCYLGGDAHAYASGDLTTIHNEIVANDDANHRPLSALYAANIKATSDLSTLTDLNTLSANKVSAVIGQDGAAFGNFLYLTAGYSISCIGAALGAVSFSNVSNSISWIAKFNMSNGSELDQPAFGNGQQLNALSVNYITAIDSLRYIFLMKYIDNAGSYFNDSHTAILITSDYAYIENNRTIDKACRGIYSSVLPALGGPVVGNADGTLADTTIAYLTGLAEINLTQMVRDGDLVGDATTGALPNGTVTIDPAQNVLATSLIIISVLLIPIGVARQIRVNIGFTAAITKTS